jgi:TonB-dependent receptor
MLLLVIAGRSMPALAQVRSLDVPSESAAKAISELSRQAGIPIIGPGEQLHGIITPEVKGTFDVTVALEMMLKGTDLVVSRTTDGIIVISDRKKMSKDPEGKNMPQNLKTGTSVLALLFGVLSAPASHAQASSAELETIVVVGTRITLGSSMDVKKNALQSVSVLTDDDLKTNPDTSLADVIRRIPGVAVNASGGGGIITIRGLSDTEDRINGRNLTSTVGRGYDIAALPADLVSGIDVYKTPSASQIEGGVGGVIDFHTRRPFDTNEFTVGGTAKYAYSDIADKWDPYLSGYIGDTWKTGVGDIGILLGGGYQEQATGQNVAFVDSNSVRPDASGRAVDAPTDIGERYMFGGKQLLTGYASVQWRPIEHLELTYDFLYNREGLDFTNQTLLASLSGATPSSTFDTYSGSNAFKSGNWTDAALQSTNSHGKGYFTTWQSGLGERYTDGNWTLSSEVSYTKTLFEYNAPSLTLAGLAPSVAVDTGATLPKFTISGVNLTDPVSWDFSNFGIWHGRDESTEWAYRGDVIYEIGGILQNIQAGIRLDERQVFHKTNYVSDTAPSTLGSLAGTGYGALTPNSIWDNGYPQQQWLVPGAVLENQSVYQGLFGMNIGTVPFDPNQAYSADERVWSQYAQLTFAFPVGEIPVDGNIGFRAAETSLKSAGFENLADGSYAPIVADQHYTDILPMINLRGELADQTYLRLSFSEQITRPAFNNLVPSLSLDYVNYTGSAGNPWLDPLRSYNYDASLEWYFDRDSYAYVAGFYKDISGYIANKSSSETINGHAYLISRPENVNSAWIAGTELGYQQRFSGLPGAFSGLGVQATFTYIDSSSSDNGAGYRVGLEQLSKANYSVAATYDYEGITASLAYTWRSRILEASSGDSSGRPKYHAPYGQLDLNASYPLSDHVSLLMNVVNLTQQRQDENFLSRNYFQNTFLEDRRIFFGVTFK